MTDLLESLLNRAHRRLHRGLTARWGVIYSEILISDKNERGGVTREGSRPSSRVLNNFTAALRRVRSEPRTAARSAHPSRSFLSRSYREYFHWSNYLARRIANAREAAQQPGRLPTGWIVTELIAYRWTHPLAQKRAVSLPMPRNIKRKRGRAFAHRAKNAALLVHSVYKAFICPRMMVVRFGGIRARATALGDAA